MFTMCYVIIGQPFITALHWLNKKQILSSQRHGPPKIQEKGCIKFNIRQNTRLKDVFVRENLNFDFANFKRILFFH